jgi:hypothetical protein
VYGDFSTAAFLSLLVGAGLNSGVIDEFADNGSFPYAATVVVSTGVALLSSIISTDYSLLLNTESLWLELGSLGWALCVSWAFFILSCCMAFFSISINASYVSSSKHHTDPGSLSQKEFEGDGFWF